MMRKNQRERSAREGSTTAKGLRKYTFSFFHSDDDFHSNCGNDSQCHRQQSFIFYIFYISPLSAVSSISRSPASQRNQQACSKTELENVLFHRSIELEP